MAWLIGGSEMGPQACYGDAGGREELPEDKVGLLRLHPQPSHPGVYLQMNTERSGRPRCDGNGCGPFNGSHCDVQVVARVRGEGRRERGGKDEDGCRKPCFAERYSFRHRGNREERDAGRLEGAGDDGSAVAIGIGFDDAHQRRIAGKGLQDPGVVTELGQVDLRYGRRSGG